MNKQRRTAIGEIYSRLKDIRLDLGNLQSEEQKAYDNIPEGLLGTETAENSEEAIDRMDDALECIDEAVEHLDEIM